MEFYQNFHVEVYDDSRARKEWGWNPRYPNFEMVVKDFFEEVGRNPERYGI
jgi:nucleoside-diphosphate-sugar epimerase